MNLTDAMKEIEANVAAILPKACELSKVEVEGPQVVIYLKNMRAFYEDENLITKTASRLRKKVLVRADASVLMASEKALQHIKSVIPPEAGVKEIRFDPNFHEVLIDAAKPGLVIGKGGMVLKRIILETGWSPKVLRTPTMPCETITAIRNSLLQQSDARKKFLTHLGKKLYTPGKPSEWVKITGLGGFREVGRSCFLLQTPSSNVIMDCGINVDPGDSSKAYPYLNATNLELDQIDAVILSHAHLDHCLHPDSLVQLANGEIKRIEELDGAGAELVSYDFVSGTAAKAVASKGTTQKPDMLKIKTNLFTIRATPEHRFFTLDGLELKEKRAGELREGDFVAALRSNKFDGVPNQLLPQIEVQQLIQISPKGLSKIRQKRESLGLTRKQAALKAGVDASKYCYFESGNHKPSRAAFELCIKALGLSLGDLEGQQYSVVQRATLPYRSSSDFCQFLGYVLGDGNAHFQARDANSNDLAITDKDASNLEFYARLAESIFLTKPRFSLKAAFGGRNRVFFSSYVTKQLMEVDDAILCRSGQRRIPGLVQRASNKEVAAFFRGLFDAEGNVGHHSIRLVSTSEMLVRVAQMLLLRLGIQSSIEERNSASPKVFTKGTAYALTITHPASLRLYSQLIGFSSKAKSTKLFEMVSKVGNALAEKLDLVPIDGKLLRQKLAAAGLYETDFDSRISRYWNESHIPSRRVLDRIIDAIEARISVLEKTHSRREIRVTLESLSQSSGVSRKTISLMESGRLAAGEEISQKIGEALGKFRESRVEKASSLLQQLRMLCSEELAWVRIKSIQNEQLPPEKVYDLSVPGYENFIADGFIVHNSGFIPFLYAYGYEGPVYCTPPTRDMMILLQQDCINVMNSEGGKAPYGERDVKKQLAHVITREYGEVTDVTSDVRFTFHNAGHMVGSAMIHLHIGEGLHNLIYSGDLKFGRTRICDSASTVFPRAETFMIEATYGGRNDIKPRIEETEAKFCEIVSNSIKQRGKLLVPVIASGRAQEIMCVLEEHFKEPDFVVYLDGMSKEASAVHTAYPEYLRRTLQRRILQNDSPFDKPMFKSVENNDHRKRIVESEEPCVILAPSGMLSGGPSLEFLKMLAHDPKSTLVFVGYQSSMTIGRKLQQGEKEIPVIESNSSKQELLKVNMGVVSLEGFSGHSDRAQLLNFIRSVRPKPSRVFTMHGDNGKCEELARTINKMLHVETRVPMNLDSVRLK